MSRITNLLKGAVELNLRYTSTLLHLSKDYLRDASVVLADGPVPDPTPKPGGDGGPTPPSRQPLLIVGHAGETASAAFAISNPSDRLMNVHLVVQGELGERVVSLDPAELALEPGKNAIVRILARLDDQLPVDKDHVGTVVAPGLIHQGVPFIVRRLAGASSDATNDAISSSPPANSAAVSHGKS